jgi:hypothetical protein
VPGAAEDGDRFGASLAVSEPQDVVGHHRQLAVGVPGEDVGRVVDAGLVNLFENDATGLRAGPGLTQSTAGVPGAAETGDRFGHSLAFRPDDGTLAVGVPYEDVGRVRDAGLVQTLAFRTRSGATAVVAGPTYTENSTGTPGRVATGNRFGLALAGLDGGREDLLTMTSPYQGTGSVFVASTRAGTTSARSWVPGRGAVPAGGGGRFGWSVGGYATGSVG